MYPLNVNGSEAYEIGPATWVAVLQVDPPSIGTRAGALHVFPSDEMLVTMSFELQPARNRQSYQLTYTLPAASTSADGTSSPRRFPAGACCWSEAIVNGPLNVAPPSWDVKDSAAEIGFVSATTTTSPLGCGTALLPITLADGTPATGVQVNPPSTEVAIFSGAPRPKSSHVK